MACLPQINKGHLSLSLSGDLCDLMLVFFDPMGQALCKRTLNIVESLNETHGDRLRFYLSKADEAGGESDRQVSGRREKAARRQRRRLSPRGNVGRK